MSQNKLEKYPRRELSNQEKKNYLTLREPIGTSKGPTTVISILITHAAGELRLQIAGGRAKNVC